MAPPATADEEGRYVLGERPSQVERARLAAIEAMWDPVTVEHLERLGVGSGWRCWEVGAGAGSVARWLADRVGASENDGGAVLTTDVDLRFLEGLDHPSVKVLRHDVAADPVPAAVGGQGGGFDLVHARLVLGWLPRRCDVVRTLAGALRPGGWLLVEDFAGVSPPSDPPSELLDKAQGAIEVLMSTVGFDTDFGARAVGELNRHGLVDVAGRASSHLLPGGSPLLAALTGTFAAFGPRLVQLGLVTSDEVDACLALFGDETYVFESARMVSSWGRRPGR